MIQMSALFEGAGIEPDVLEGKAEIERLSADSRHIDSGTLFISMPSPTSDGMAYLKEAIAKGAAAVLVHSEKGLEVARFEGVPRAAMIDEGLRFPELIWRLCRAFYKNPTKDMKVVGVTGTNGKTTVAWLMRDMIQNLGEKAGYLGTLGFQIPGVSRELLNTTPFSVDLMALLAEARDNDVQALSIEVSSHALDQRRIDGVDFDAAVFTNLTQDHLDYHGSMEAYAQAKFRLFRELGPRSGKCFKAALNVGDKYGKIWSQELGSNVLTFGLRSADLVGKALSVELNKIQLQLAYEGGKIVTEVPLGGSFNVQNCLSAAAGMLCLGYSLDQIGEALTGVRPVPGRFEPVPNDKGIGIIVDYAHTPDALQKLLDSVRQLHPARIVTVFGCGGDRDRTKRPKMAKAASERSDMVVLTSDNPRSEDPAQILKDVERGLLPGVDACSIIDRREAIQYTLKKAHPGDVVVIAGKGHENYQIIGRTKYPMDDREIAREALKV